MIKPGWKQVLTENLSYKFVSLLIALILWVTIIGRRDFVYTKTFEIELRVPETLVVVAQTADRVKVRVSGSRASLKKFMESPEARTLKVDVPATDAGMFDIDVPSHKVDAPAGIKVLSVRPNVIRVEVKRRPE